MKKDRFHATVSHSLALAAACLLSYWLATGVLSRVHSLSKSDDQIGGLWAVLATLFVFRESHRASLAVEPARCLGAANPSACRHGARNRHQCRRRVDYLASDFMGTTRARTAGPRSDPCIAMTIESVVTPTGRAEIEPH